MSIFLAGLEHHTHTHMHVRMFNRTTIVLAANLEKLRESSRATLSKDQSRFGSFWTKPSTSNTKTFTSQTPLATTTTLSAKTLSAAEMTYRRAKGL